MRWMIQDCKLSTAVLDRCFSERVYRYACMYFRMTFNVTSWLLRCHYRQSVTQKGRTRIKISLVMTRLQLPTLTKRLLATSHLDPL